MTTAAIATHLNVSEPAIIEIQEWASVLWVRVKGLGARFVSKKVVQKKEGISPAKVREFASWMQQIDIDKESTKISGKWLVFDCDTESYYRKDICTALRNAKQAGFTCFAKNDRCGVLVESVSY